MGNQYFKDRDRKNLNIMRMYTPKLPPICKEYFDDVSIAKAPSTMANYARTLLVFFTFMTSTYIEGKAPNELNLDDVTGITTRQITTFLNELKNDGDSEDTLKNYMNILSAFYKYLINRGVSEINPVAAIPRPKKKKKPRIYLDKTDYERFENTISSGFGLTKHELQYRDAIGTADRDYLILSILSDTGIRVSELVGLDVENIDQKRHRFTVQRKGGNVDNVYYSDATGAFLSDYLISREHIADPEEKALLLSFTGKSKGTRLSVRAIEILIKKYALAAGISNSEKMTPHKLRHTCAMTLLRATGNLALVKKQLGHSSITSTTIYAESEDADLQAIRNIKPGH